MDKTEAEQWVAICYRLIMQRVPTNLEADNWVNQLVSKQISPYQFLSIIEKSAEYKSRIEIQNRIKPFVPAGHYYSPIVDPESVKPYFKKSARAGLSALKNINYDMENMIDILKSSIDIINSTDFKTGKGRFYDCNKFFPSGDAIILKTMMVLHRPKNIFEIGSGFSTALMLDTIEEYGLKTKIKCVEPYPERLKKLMRPEDTAHVEIKEVLAQDVDPSEMLDLECNDILFIDSTHVLKTCSDVCHQIFQLIPALNKGVLIHFHDCQYPFEYPENWIFGNNHSWNELYALRAFLQYNNSFKIKMWGGMIKAERPVDMNGISENLSNHIFTSLWMQKIK